MADEPKSGVYGCYMFCEFKPAAFKTSLCLSLPDENQKDTTKLRRSLKFRANTMELKIFFLVYNRVTVKLCSTKTDLHSMLLILNYLTTNLSCIHINRMGVIFVLVQNYGRNLKIKCSACRDALNYFSIVLSRKKT